MSNIKDCATIYWTDKNGKELQEDLITYETEVVEAEEEEEAKSTPSYEMIHLESVSIDKLLLVLVIDDMLEKLGILRCAAQQDHQPIPFKFPEYKTIDERFGPLIEYEEDLYSESKKRYIDLTVIYSILFRTLEELASTGSYAPLIEATRIIKRLHDDEQKLFTDETETRLLEEEYKRKLKTQKRDLDTEYKQKLAELRQLELELENAIEYGNMEYNYLENWEDARRHQAVLMLERAENKHKEVIASNQTQIDLENRIHGEIMKFFQENAEELSNDISYWMYRYESEIEIRDAELLKLRFDRDTQMEKYNELKATYESQKEFIEYWNGVKVIRILAEQQKEKKRTASVKIQRWWRVLLQKHNLGPYKPKAVKGKGKQKGKGKRK